MINVKNQSAGENSIQLIADNGSTINYQAADNQEQADYGIIEEILNHLVLTKFQNTGQSKELKNGKGLKKIPLNFSGDSLSTVKELVLKTTQRRQYVEKFIHDKREIDESKIDALVLTFQMKYRELKGSETHYQAIEDVKIIDCLAKACIEKKNENNPDYLANAIAVVLYFFEMCDFGVSDVAKPEIEAVF